MDDSIPLSPAAQAVLDAVTARLDWDARYHSHSAAAAALRAAARQLREAYENEEYVPSADDWLDDLATELNSLDS